MFRFKYLVSYGIFLGLKNPIQKLTPLPINKLFCLKDGTTPSQLHVMESIFRTTMQHPLLQISSTNIAHLKKIAINLMIFFQENISTSRIEFRKSCEEESLTKPIL